MIFRRAALGLLLVLIGTVTPAQVTSYREYLKQEAEPYSDTIFVHLVPHSYNPTFLAQLDDFFPWTKEDLL
jgi:hypothetical protein